VNPASPLENKSIASSEGTVIITGTTSISGYSIIETDSMETALEIAKLHSILEIAGSLELSGLVRIPGY
jgi:hypothetical protein